MRSQSRSLRVTSGISQTQPASVHLWREGQDTLVLLAGNLRTSSPSLCQQERLDLLDPPRPKTPMARRFQIDCGRIAPAATSRVKQWDTCIHLAVPASNYLRLLCSSSNHLWLNGPRGLGATQSSLAGTRDNNPHSSNHHQLETVSPSVCCFSECQLHMAVQVKMAHRSSLYH